jgi:hypothetical protein
VHTAGFSAVFFCFVTAGFWGRSVALAVNRQAGYGSVMTALIPFVLVVLGGTPNSPLTADPATRDLGTLRAGPIATSTFTLSHTGTAGTIQILRIITGCGCLKPTCEPQLLKPGTRAKLTLAVNTLTPPEGLVTWSARVLYRLEDDPVDAPPRELPVQLKAKILREIQVHPPLLAATIHGEWQHPISLTDRRPTPLKLKSVQSTRPEIEVRLGETTAETQAIEVRVSKSVATGIYEAEAVLLTDDSAYPEIRVPIRIVKQEAGSISITPNQPVLRLSSEQEESSILLQLRRGGNPLQIEQVDVTEPGLKVRWSEARGPVGTIRVIVRKQDAGAAGIARLTIKLAEPKSTTETLLVSWYTP